MQCRVAGMEYQGIGESRKGRRRKNCTQQTNRAEISSKLKKRSKVRFFRLVYSTVPHLAISTRIPRLSYRSPHPPLPSFRISRHLRLLCDRIKLWTGGDTPTTSFLPPLPSYYMPEIIRYQQLRIALLASKNHDIHFFTLCTY